jgi:hypothetical protein
MAAKQLQDEMAQEQQRVWYQVPFLKYPHLTGHTSLLMDPNDIQEIFHDKTHIEIASDGGHDPESGISTFGWVIAANTSLMAKGRGPAQAHPSGISDDFHTKHDQRI